MLSPRTHTEDDEMVEADVRAQGLAVDSTGGGGAGAMEAG